MKVVEIAFQEFVDALQTAITETAFRAVAERTAHRLGFRYFAYLAFSENEPTLLSSYPRSWTNRYFAEGYEQVDPVVEHARRERTLFRWDGTAPPASGSTDQRRFFDEAVEFGIKCGVTVPIMGGFGRFAAFTLAADETSEAFSSTVDEASDVLQLIGLYFHAHVDAKLACATPTQSVDDLTQRERQCLAWVSRGKTMEEVAIILGVKPRTVLFHIENARQRLGASTSTQAVAVALRRGLLP